MLPALDSRSLELEYAADPRVVQVVRRHLDDFVRPLGLDPDELEGLKVAVSEAFSNAVCHGSPLGDRNRVGFRCTSTEERLEIEITDEGGGFRPTQIQLPTYEEWKTSGRGLFLMQHLVDQIEFEPTATGTRVRLVKQLAREEEEPEYVSETPKRPAHPVNQFRFAGAAGTG